MARIRLWDLPTRLFHWTLAAAVIGAFATESAGRMNWHAICGLTVLGLVTFRIVWGFAGSRYARFTQFVRGPQAVRDYLRGRWHGVGHNPLGALSVLALLGLLLAQVGTGLFANDDSTFTGPLYELVSRHSSDLLTEIHETTGGLVFFLVLLHIGAIVWHRVARKENLVQPMITGDKDGVPEGTPGADGGGVVAFLVAVAIAVAVVYLASGALLPAAPPVEAIAPTPDW